MNDKITFTKQDFLRDCLQALRWAQGYKRRYPNSLWVDDYIVKHRGYVRHWCRRIRETRGITI